MDYEAIDRHTETRRKNKVALYHVADRWERKYTYQEMRLFSNRFGSVLRNLGIRKIRSNNYDRKLCAGTQDYGKSS